MYFWKRKNYWGIMLMICEQTFITKMIQEIQTMRNTCKINYFYNLITMQSFKIFDRSIRIVEEDRLKFSKLPLLQLTEPTYRSQIKKKKPHYETNKISVSDLYFCPNPAARESLRIIKMRNSRVSLKNAMDSLK